MRHNIKFRAWDRKNKTFPFEGFHVIGEVTAFNLLKQYSLEEYNDLDVTEFIGVRDKNGKDIYEGDIVKFSYSTSEKDVENEQGEVFFEEGIFYFGRKAQFAMNDCNFNDESLEVIGNIFENPELSEKVS